MTLELQPLRLDQFKQAAEWEWGRDVNVDDYAALLESPNRLNFGVYQGGRFCAFISIERLGTAARFHVSKEPRVTSPQQMADLLATIADYLFQNGFEEMQAAFPQTNRAARRLAIRSWMSPKGEFEEDGVRFQTYATTKSQYYGRSKIQSN